MSNVIPFSSRIVSYRAAAATARAEAVAAVAVAGRHEDGAGASVVRDDLRKTVILLDLALQHARELSDLVTDERAHRTFDRHLDSIAYSLQIARERMGAS